MHRWPGVCLVSLFLADAVPSETLLRTGGTGPLGVNRRPTEAADDPRDPGVRHLVPRPRSCRSTMRTGGERFPISTCGRYDLLCPPVEGVPVFASFHGTPSSASTRRAAAPGRQLEFWTGSERIGPEPVSEAHFFTLRGKDLAGQWGSRSPRNPPRRASRERSWPPGVPRVSHGPGLRLSQPRRRGGGNRRASRSRSNRSGRSGTADSFVMYSFDPQTEQEVTLGIAGHASRMPPVDYRYSFLPIAQEHSSSRRFRAAAGAGLPHGGQGPAQIEGDDPPNTPRSVSAPMDAGALRLRYATRMQVVGGDRRARRAAPVPAVSFQGDGPGARTTTSSCASIRRSSPAGKPGSRSPRKDRSSRASGPTTRTSSGSVSSPYEIVTGWNDPHPG